MIGLQRLAAFVLAITVALAGVAPEALQAQLAKKSGSKFIEINDKNYREIMGGARDYHLVLMMSTDLTMINCLLCREFKPVFSLVANSWFEDHPLGIGSSQTNEDDDTEPKDIFFAYSDFANSRALFNEFLLQSIPKVFYFPPTQSKLPSNYVKNFGEYPFYQGDHAELLRDWCNEITGHKITLHIPLDYKLIAFNAAVTLVVVVTAYVFSAKLKAFLASKYIWCALSLISVLLFTCGYMFNRMRNTPFVRETEQGPQYFAPGQQSQYGIETQLVLFIYGLLSLCVVLLVKKLPQLKNGQVQLLGACTVCAIVFVAYSLLLNFFAIKSPGYPYHLAI